MKYDGNKHILLRNQAHKAKLTPEEFSGFERHLKESGVTVFDVEVPDWPPAEKSPLQLGGGNPFEGESWEGTQPAISNSDYAGRRLVTKLAREMAGPRLAPKRLAYQWQVPEFDPERHILMRQWLAENEVSIVDFLREYIPKVRKEIGRDPLFEVANPHAQAESDAGGGYSPTRRALAIDDLLVLNKFAQVSERFTYDSDQPVTWVRALDDSRWEARRQHPPQQERWENHRSWINRTIGDGAWTEEDRGPEGHAFGPFMELWDDGAMQLWCYKRALSFLEDNALIINGVSVSFTPEKIGHVCRMVGHVENVSAILGIAPERIQAEKRIQQPLRIDCHFEQKGNGPFWHLGANPSSPFHRASERPPLVFRLHNDGSGQVRAWGDKSLLDGFTLNGVGLYDFAPWQSGFRIQVDAADTEIILERDRSSQPLPVDPKPSPPSDVTDGASAYSPASVINALQETLGRSVSLFGRSASDSAVVALTRQGLNKFLLDDLSDRDLYVTDAGGRNYDCENFAERLRVNLAVAHGVNGCMVIWGDGHAFNAFAVVGSAGPDIVLVEPQTDEIVTSPEREYSIERRAEVLL